MKTSHSALALALVMTVAGNSWSQDVSTKKPSIDETQSKVAEPAAPAFSVHDRNIQQILAAAAQAQSVSSLEKNAANDAEPATGPMVLKFKAPRRVHHTDCDSFYCVAYNADDIALFTVPREQYYGVHSDKPADAWLACQSGDDMLSTFERYDNCRGITIGLPPLGFGNVLLDTPKLTF